jgi:hypothetical protein
VTKEMGKEQGRLPHRWGQGFLQFTCVGMNRSGNAKPHFSASWGLEKMPVKSYVVERGKLSWIGGKKALLTKRNTHK